MDVHRCCGRAPTDPPTCSSEGFSLVEVLVALCLSVVILMGISALWVATVRTGLGSQETLIEVQRWRVVSARMERDLRVASADGVSGLSGSPLLEASPTRLVMITRSTSDEGLEIVAWEFVNGVLMRRRAPLPVAGPPVSIGGFRDNKTMLEGVEGGVFSYAAGAFPLGGTVSSAALRSVDAVAASCSVTAGDTRRRVTVSGGAGVGR